jgi:hypothetical protein
MTGEEFENVVEELLIKYNLVYKREGKQIAYGHKASKGKCDFQLNKYAIECKAISDLIYLSIPSINPKTHKPYVSTKIHTHQLKHLRAFKSNGYLLIHESNSNTFYALSMTDFDRFIIKHDLPRSLKGIDEHKIELEEFISKLTN